jgi:hypothetical protein
MWGHSSDQAHNLEKGEADDRFFATCLRVASSNIKAIALLSSPYSNECGAIFRNLVEVCTDYFWVASLLEDDPPKGKLLTDHFFIYGHTKFAQSAESINQFLRDDPFFRDIETPYGNADLVVAAKTKTAHLGFGKSWRQEKSLFPNSRDTIWEARAEKAATFAAKAVNLKKAPFLQNLKILSEYSHFSPAQIMQPKDTFLERVFDRNLNIAIGFVYDMLPYSRKKWNVPEPLRMLQNLFVWFST